MFFFLKKLKYAFIIGIHKGREKMLPKNYRPISLTCHWSKVLEKVMRKDIIEYLNDNDLWDVRQHGSRAGRSTLSQLLAHQDAIINAMENGSNMEVVYLDFAKAYDKVDHHLLLLRLREMGITGNIGKWLGSFILERTQYVKVGDEISEGRQIMSGIPQGSVMVPILFIIFVQNMGLDTLSTNLDTLNTNLDTKKDEHDTKNTNAFIYVDDAKVLKEIKNEKDAMNFQEDLQKYYRWTDINNMQFNNGKFVALRYGKNELLKQDTLYFTNNWESPIDTLDSHRDLGVQMASNGTFDCHIEEIIKK